MTRGFGEQDRDAGDPFVALGGVCELTGAMPSGTPDDGGGPDNNYYNPPPTPSPTPAPSPSPSE